MQLKMLQATQPQKSDLDMPNGISRLYKCMTHIFVPFGSFAEMITGNLDHSPFMLNGMHMLAFLACDLRSTSMSNHAKSVIICTS